MAARHVTSSLLLAEAHTLLLNHAPQQATLCVAIRLFLFAAHSLLLSTSLCSVAPPHIAKWPLL